ncbi:MAG TPA: hypothetical protein VKV39_20155 [Candidatus Sulfotelmatobacter sp.]|nr:hypothetical protein [Candidatus Sulfotelmatobacter sp.]
MRIVSFSGIDGAGKTTQIDVLRSWLHDCGCTVNVLRMWDDVVVGSRLRERASSKLFGGEQGIGCAERPVQRRDKNVTSWPVRIARLALYFADAWSLLLKARRLKLAGEYDVVIFDRYIYDELANLPLDHGFARFFARLLLYFAPQPDLAYMVDADPELARARKPEYPLEFLRLNRQSYLNLVAMAPDIVVITGASVSEASAQIRATFCRRLFQPESCEVLARA